MTSPKGVALQGIADVPEDLLLKFFIIQTYNLTQILEGSKDQTGQKMWPLMICILYQKYCKAWRIYVNKKVENTYPRIPLPGWF